MSKYDTYLKEIRMTSADAAAVKLAYRKASMQNHPDRGGSTEAMQNVNSAYDILKGGFKGTAVNYREEYAARKAAYEQAGAQIVSWFERVFKPEAFQAYFKELFGQEFTATQKNETTPSTRMPTSSGISSHRMAKSGSRCCSLLRP